MSRGRRDMVAGALALASGLSLVMAACSETGTTDEAGRLAADPERLAKAQEDCRTGDVGASDATCRMAAEATRRRFQDGGVPYTPGGSGSPPSQPAPARPN